MVAVAGEGARTAYYLGRELRVEAARSVWRRARLEGDVLTVEVCDPANEARVQAQAAEWFRAQAAAVLPVCLREACERCRLHLANASRPLAPRTAACPEGLRLTVRAMRTRWGSCTADGRITLSSALIHVPRRLIDYVIVHELCHLVRLDHSRAYYFNLARCMPDWRERRRELQSRSWARARGG
jgi:predicted metal-dependent hydrolase